MKKIALLALLSVSAQAAPVLNNVPFYFAVPQSAKLKVTKEAELAKALSASGITVKSIPIEGHQIPLDLRAVVVKDPNKLVGGVVARTAKSVITAKSALRGKIVNELMNKGLIEEGDVILSFRPEWRGTVAYSHVQMGVSHAAIAFKSVDNKTIHNLDMPIDSIYNGPALNSSLNATHYLETDNIHIVRPRAMTAERKAKLKAWVMEFRKNYLKIRNAGLLKFNVNYMDSKYGTKGLSFVKTLGNILKGRDLTSKDLTMFCSEFAWSMLALSNCSQTEFDTNADACISPVIPAKEMVSETDGLGLTEGPLALIRAAATDVKNDTLDPVLAQTLADELFTSKAIEALSPGHRALAENKDIQKLMSILNPVYMAKLMGLPTIPVPSATGTQDVPVPMFAAQVNAGAPKNYSPTGFLINTLLPEKSADRAFDYVMTIVFED